MSSVSVLPMHKRLFDRFLVEQISAGNSPRLRTKDGRKELISEVSKSNMDLTEEEVNKFVDQLGISAFSTITAAYKGALTVILAMCHCSARLWVVVHSPN